MNITKNNKWRKHSLQQGKTPINLTSMIVVVLILSFSSYACKQKLQKESHKSAVVKTKANDDKIATKTTLTFMQWLYKYIPNNYSNAKMTDHTYWLQAHIGDDLVVNWAQIDDKGADLRYLEGHNLIPGQSFFIEKGVKKDWADHPSVTYFDAVGYYVSTYDTTAMRSWDIEGCSVVQYDGEAAAFTEKMAKAWISYSKKDERPETETEFTNWLKKYTSEKNSGKSYDPHNGWYQVYIPEHELTISWGLAPQQEIALKMVEGLSESKPIFIAKEAKLKWAEDPKVDYSPGVGYNIPEYLSATMGEFNVGQVTIIQFDGKPKMFVDKMVKAYQNEREKSELTFHKWLKEYVKISYPALKIDFHGGWYQSHFTQPDLTVTWGTMSAYQMALKDLHGVREDKSIFIEKSTNEGWEKLPAIEYNKGVGYYISKYESASMGDFEVGNTCVIQFDGDSKEFTEEMVKAWIEVSNNAKP